MASRFLLHLLPAMARAIRFVLRQGSEILDLAVAQARVKAVGLAACPRPERVKGSHQAFVAAGFFAARSLPVGLSDFPTGLVTADPVIAFDLSAAAGSVVAGPDLVVVAAVAVADSVLAGSVVAAFSFEAGQRCLEALDHLETSLIP